MGGGYSPLWVGTSEAQVGVSGGSGWGPWGSGWGLRGFGPLKTDFGTEGLMVKMN